MAQARFASAKAEIEKLRVAQAGLATPSNKHTLGASGDSVSAEARAVGAGSASIVSIIQHQLTRGVGHPFSNMIPFQGVPSISTQSLVSTAPHTTLPSQHPAFVNFPMQKTSIPNPPLISAVPFPSPPLMNQFPRFHPSRNITTSRPWCVAGRKRRRLPHLV